MKNPSTGDSAGDPNEPLGIAPAALAYLSDALNIMEQNSLHRNRIDWLNLRAEAFALACGAMKPEETYSAIRTSLVLLGDHHSFLNTPTQKSNYDNLGIADNAAPMTQLMEDRIAYLSLPGFRGLSS